MIKTICLRLNLDKPLHNQAFEYLQNMDKSQFKSYSHAIALATTEYFQRHYKSIDDPYFETREREEQFIAQIVLAVEKSIEKAMPSFLTACLTGIVKPYQPVEYLEPLQDEELAEIDLDFIGG